MGKLTTREIINDDIDSWISYNDKVHPEREDNKESFFYRFRLNPFYTNYKCLISLLEDNTVVGKCIKMPTRVSFNNKISEAYWGGDLFVDEDQRSSLLGITLIQNVTKNCFLFSVGFSEDALKLNLALKQKITGYLQKYIRVNSVFSILKLVLKKSNNTPINYPSEIKIRKSLFINIDNTEDILSKDGFWGSNNLEFTRSAEFLDWRFFKNPNVYKMFKLKNGDINGKSAYFVVTSLKWKNLTCLSLVDYRYNNKKQLNTILKAVNKIAYKNNIPFTFTANSLPSFNHLFKKNLYIKFGKRMEIVSNYKILFKANPNSDTILLTLADSDLDFYNNNNRL